MKKSSLVSVVVLFALMPFVLMGCPKKSAGGADASDEGGPSDTTISTASAEPSASAPAHTDVKVGCRPGETLMKVKGAHGVESHCHHPCKTDSECPRDRPFCWGTTVVDGQGYCESLKESQPKCKANEKLVQGSAATLFNCAAVCKTDADCKTPGSKCDQTSDLLDGDNNAIHYKACTAPDSPPTPSAKPSAAPSAASGKLVAPPDQPFAFPNPKHLPCPVPYFLSGDNCQMSSRPQ